ncbi:sRNA-binding carbon storage regulator CsrA [Pseudomonas nitritireducens]|uniref:SRNA-binding carbon storage regulator CsrA n=1 Tax=Pseudomonas nitroreducens TaxID=46680 RepID=A0A7W7P567_PSENT|nr:hypothetical protein [Pseudomonas nitritireducens]MBB4867634.1 sRNA-binding carbon storage regulator CsrA [Pseudomonas nitritireducens]
MQIYQSRNRTGDVISLNILNGQVDDRIMRLLLTQGIEIEFVAIENQAVQLIIRAPRGMWIVEEIESRPPSVYE